MSDYTLKKGEIFNGGYEVTLGDYTLRHIGSYAPVWTKVYDSSNSFIDYQGNSVKTLKGNQFSISIKTGRLIKSDMDALITELNKAEITLSCPDYEGVVTCEDVNTNLEQANTLGTRYSVSFKLTAKNITPVGSL